MYYFEVFGNGFWMKVFEDCIGEGVVVVGDVFVYCFVYE